MDCVRSYFETNKCFAEVRGGGPRTKSHEKVPSYCFAAEVDEGEEWVGRHPTANSGSLHPFRTINHSVGGWGVGRGWGESTPCPEGRYTSFFLITICQQFVSHQGMGGWWVGGVGRFYLSAETFVMSARLSVTA